MSVPSYDFIILGGGTSGLVLAHHLSQHPNLTVCVLEAGSDLSSDPRVLTPALFPTLLNTEADWASVTEPQTHLNGKRLKIPHGRGLGGSSAINGHTFVPISKANIDAWGELGNEGWGWEVLEKYLRRAFTLNIPEDEGLRKHLGLEHFEKGAERANGPLQTSFPQVQDLQLPRAWLDALGELGHEMKGDPFLGTGMGAFSNAETIDPVTRMRSYAASAYFQSVKKRPNLHIITEAFVEKILFDDSASNGSDLVATGAVYIKEGKQHSINATKEVVISAGTFHTPKILELSGIGNSNILRNLGIDVKIDNPNVGENLQDHPMIGLSFEVQDGVKTLDSLFRQDDPAQMGEAMKAYQEHQSGPLAASSINSYALLPLDSASRGSEAILRATEDARSQPSASKDVEHISNLLLSGTSPAAGYIAYSAQGPFDANAADSPPMSGETMLLGNYITIALYLLQPLSRGSVHIRSANPSDSVVLDPKYLSHPLDQEVLARSVSYISNIITTSPMKALLKPDGKRNRTAPKSLDDLETVRRYVKSQSSSGWHPTSTCAMLPRERGGVVDARLKVYGAKNLRIVDASVMPITPGGNPLSCVYAVAERAADLVKEDWGL